MQQGRGVLELCGLWEVWSVWGGRCWKIIVRFEARLGVSGGWKEEGNTRRNYDVRCYRGMNGGLHEKVLHLESF